jgi:hypothetical protein
MTFDIEAMRRDREAGTPGPWRVFIDDSGGRWVGWPLSIEADSITDKSIVRPGGHWPYEWDAKTSQHEAVANACRIARVPAMEAEIERLRGEVADYLPMLDAAEFNASIMAAEIEHLTALLAEAKAEGARKWGPWQEGPIPPGDDPVYMQRRLRCGRWQHRLPLED